MGWVKNLICKVRGHKGNFISSSVLRIMAPTDIFAMSENVKVDFSEVILRVHQRRCGCGFSYVSVLDPIVKPYSSLSFERVRQFKDALGVTHEATADSTVGRYAEFCLPQTYENFVNVNTYIEGGKRTMHDAGLAWFLNVVERLWEDDPDTSAETRELLRLMDGARKNMFFLVDSAIVDPIGRFECIDMLKQRL